MVCILPPLLAALAAGTSAEGVSMYGHSPVFMSDADQATQRAVKNGVDSPAAARGRRTLSTAFVRVGADGYLTVELNDGRTLVLRDVVMGPQKYCGKPASGNPVNRSHCGSYADIAAAYPGGAPAPLGPSDAGSWPPAALPNAKRTPRP